MRVGRPAAALVGGEAAMQPDETRCVVII
jgi:hypothetical protein